jgi:hypothetical protein
MAFVKFCLVPLYALAAFFAWALLPGRSQPYCLGMPDSQPYCHAAYEAAKSPTQHFLESPIPYAVAFLVLSAVTIAIAKMRGWE